MDFMGIVGEFRVGFVEGKYVFNILKKELENLKLDLVVVGIKDVVLMVELEVNGLREEEMLNVVKLGEEGIVIIIKMIEEFGKE
jgi:Polyribonucleotide nucleotidyltransferase (polynucleotide phosphorylase)